MLHTMSILRPDDGQTLDFGFSSLRIVLRSEDTGGAFGLMEQPLEPGALAGPLHLHANEISFFYVLDGEICVQVGDDVVRAGPRSTVPVPAGLRHTFWNPGTVLARALEFFAPGGFERWFAELAGFMAGGTPDLEGIVQSARHFGTDMDFDSLPLLIEGQIRGLQRMVDEETYCIDVLTQISAATKALESVALELLDDHLAHCVREAVATGGPEADAKVAEASAAIARLVRS
jgi:DNA-binding FrmR family transcriptional regulator/mannose-6-phosphate isomerase-like protein (cupin superfamily)